MHLDGEAIEVPRAAGIAVAVDDGADGGGRRRRFAVRGDGGERIAWLWTRGADAFPPLLGAQETTPNLAILLDRRIPLPRRPAAAGVLLRVADPSAARAAFASWGFPDGLTSGALASAYAADPPRGRRPTLKA